MVNSNTYMYLIPLIYLSSSIIIKCIPVPCRVVLLLQKPEWRRTNYLHLYARTILGNNDLSHPCKFLGYCFPYYKDMKRMIMKYNRMISISIYTLSDLGVIKQSDWFSSRTIQQYSPPSEWIMCELGVFFNYLKSEIFQKLTKSWG